MASAGVSPNAMTFTVLLTGCAQSLRAEAAQRLMARMREAGLVPNAYTLTALVTVHSACGDWRRAVGPPPVDLKGPFSNPCWNVLKPLLS
jgi:pentatricopeptide repeat protein